MFASPRVCVSWFTFLKLNIIWTNNVTSRKKCAVEFLWARACCSFELFSFILKSAPISSSLLECRHITTYDADMWKFIAIHITQGCMCLVRWGIHVSRLYLEGILLKGPYPPCLHMADRALLAGYPRSVSGYIFYMTSSSLTPQYNYVNPPSAYSSMLFLYLHLVSVLPSASLPSAILAKLFKNDWY